MLLAGCHLTSVSRATLAATASCRFPSAHTQRVAVAEKARRPAASGEVVAKSQPAQNPRSRVYRPIPRVSSATTRVTARRRGGIRAPRVNNGNSAANAKTSADEPVRRSPPIYIGSERSLPRGDADRSPRLRCSSSTITPPTLRRTPSRWNRFLARSGSLVVDRTPFSGFDAARNVRCACTRTSARRVGGLCRRRRGARPNGALHCRSPWRAAREVRFVDGYTWHFCSFDYSRPRERRDVFSLSSRPALGGIGARTSAWPPGRRVALPYVYAHYGHTEPRRHAERRHYSSLGAPATCCARISFDDFDVVNYYRPVTPVCCACGMTAGGARARRAPGGRPARRACAHRALCSLAAGG